MKAWSVATISCLLGVSVAVGTVLWDYSGTRASFDELRTAGSDWSTLPANGEGGKRGRAKLEMEDEKDYDFGVMTLGETKSHTFRVKNVGTAPLVLYVRETTCLCTEVELPPDPVAPGEAAEIVLHWRARGRNLAYRHSATLDTSDPTQRTLILSIHGQVQQEVRPTPTEVVFHGILAHKSSDAELVIYGYGRDQLGIARVALLNEDTRDYFEVTWRPLGAKELAKEQGAKCGVVVTITAKPGMAVGPINQRMQIFFDPPDLDSIEIPIKGNVVSDITIIGPRRDFDPDNNLVTFRQVSRQQGAKATVWVIAKGDHASQVVLTPEEIFPNDLLRVTVGESKSLSNGTTVRIPVTVEIPPGSRSANHLGSQQGRVGHVKFHTNHPEAPTLLLNVSFVVGDFN